MFEPILITGAARSGTSLVAGVMVLCGAWCGSVRKPNAFNRKGMFENVEIINEVIKPLLVKVGADPRCQKPLPVTSQFDMLPDEFFVAFRESVLRIIKSQGYEDGPWIVKEPKLTMTWKAWVRAFPKAPWVIVRRSPEDVVTSCIKTSFMNAYSTRPGWLGWLAIHEKRFEEMYNANLDIHQIWPQRAVDGDFTELQGIVNHLGLKWDFEKVLEFVTPSMWHKTKAKDLLRNSGEGSTEEVKEYGNESNAGAGQNNN